MSEMRNMCEEGRARGAKVLYAASTFLHLKRFHLPYIEALMRDGFEVVLLASEDDALDEMPTGARCIPVNFVKSMSSPTNFKTAAQIARLQRAEHFDTVLLNTSLAAFFVRLGLMMAGQPRQARPRVVNTVHGYLFDDAMPFAKRQIMLGAERFCAGITDCIVTMNRQDALIARKYKLCRGEVLETCGMGVDLTGKQPPTQDQRCTARRELGLSEDSFVCLYAAEFSSRKNQRMLIEAIRELPQSVVLALPGTGDLWESCRDYTCQEELSSRVFMPGQIDQERLATWRAAADICVSTSRFEGLPFHMVESFACGLPAVASNIKGHEDLIVPGHTGLLYPLGNINALRRCIEQLSCDQQLIASMRSQAVAASKQYEIGNVFPHLLKIYEGSTC